MKAITLLFGVSIKSIGSEVDKVEAESTALQQREQELYSLSPEENGLFQQRFLLTENRRSELCSKADYLVNATHSIDLYRKFRMLGLKVRHPFRTMFVKFVLVTMVLLGLTCAYFSATRAIQSSDWYASRHIEKSKDRENKLIFDVTKAYYVALEKKSNAEMSNMLWLVEDANEAITEYHTMLSCIPIEKRGDLTRIDYIGTTTK